MFEYVNCSNRVMLLLRKKIVQNQEGISYLVWFCLPEAGKHNVDGHIHLRILNSCLHIFKVNT